MQPRKHWHGHFIASLRSRLGLKQTELATLFGVHPITISKWERGQLTPKPYMVMLLDVADRAVARNPSVGVGIAAALATTENPIAAALQVMFRAAYQV